MQPETGRNADPRESSSSVLRGLSKIFWGIGQDDGDLGGALDFVVSAYDFNQLVQTRALAPVFSLQSPPHSYIDTSPYSSRKTRGILVMKYTGVRQLNTAPGWQQLEYSHNVA